jgi:alcohol dehydrogenase, propanol-preferring
VIGLVCLGWGGLAAIANLTRADGDEFLALIQEVPVKTHTTAYPLSQSNQALADLRAGRLSGAAVLVPDLDA